MVNDEAGGGGMGEITKDSVCSVNEFGIYPGDNGKSLKGF